MIGFTASFPEPFALPFASDCGLRKEIVLISQEETHSAWGICADDQTFEGPLLSAENVLKEIRN